MSPTTAQNSGERQYFTVATAGHVDHGKTSLIKSLTGIDPDRLKEEKERQMTTDLGFAHLRLSNKITAGFIDVPGHGKFLKNMLAGVGGIDLALIVVAADEGLMPQTIQHVRILNLLGVSSAIVAITKIDLVERQTLELVKDDVQALLASNGIKALAICAVSSTHGIGIGELKEALCNILKELEPREAVGTAFLPIDRVFVKTGFGTVITGTIVKGKLAVGDQVFVAPDGLSARVRRLETFGNPVNVAHSGQRVACNLVLKGSLPLARGQIIVGQMTPPTKVLLVNLVDKPKSTSSLLSKHLSNQPIRFYHGTAEYHGHLRWVKESSKYHDGTSLEGSAAIALVSLVSEAVVEPRDHFVIRLTNDSIYGGTILMRDRPKWIGHTELLALSQLLLQEDYEEAILTLIELSPRKILKRAYLEWLLLPSVRGGSAIAKLLNQNQIVQIGEQLLSNSAREKLSERLLKTLSESFSEKAGTKKANFQEGLPLESLRVRFTPKLDRSTFNHLLDEEIGKGSIIRQGDKLFIPGSCSKDNADPALLLLEQKVFSALKTNFCLGLEELAELCATDSVKIKQIVQAMSKTGEATIVGYEFVCSTANITKAHEILAIIWQKNRSIAPTDFKEALGITRKYAMALLQFFDDQKITRRLPSGRILLRSPDLGKP